MDNSLRFSNKKSGEAFSRLPENIKKYLSEKMSDGSTFGGLDDIDKDFLEKVEALKMVLSNTSEKEIGIIAINDLLDFNEKKENINIPTKTGVSNILENKIDTEKHLDRYKHIILNLSTLYNVDNLKNGLNETNIEEFFYRINESFESILEIYNDYNKGDTYFKNEIKNLLGSLDIRKVTSRKNNNDSIFSIISNESKKLIPDLQKLINSNLENKKEENDFIADKIFNIYCNIIFETNLLYNLNKEDIKEDTQNKMLFDFTIGKIKDLV